jgi:hypothetical protein
MIFFMPRSLAGNEAHTNNWSRRALGPTGTTEGADLDGPMTAGLQKWAERLFLGEIRQY